jgi:hypothetical protein
MELVLMLIQTLPQIGAPQDLVVSAKKSIQAFIAKIK